MTSYSDRIVVVNENTFGRLYDIGEYTYCTVYRSRVFNEANGPMVIMPADVVRDATEEDYAKYRISYAEGV